MKSFVLFDRNTGEVLGTHIQADELRKEEEEILKTTGPAREGVAVEVMQVEALEPETSYRVDIKSRKLVPAEEGEAVGSGGAVVQSAEGDPLAARAVVFRTDRKRPKW